MFLGSVEEEEEDNSFVAYAHTKNSFCNLINTKISDCLVSVLQNLVFFADIVFFYFKE